MAIIKPGIIFRSNSGRPCDPYPKPSKKGGQVSDNKHKKWLVKQANDELEYLKEGTGNAFWFSGANDTTQETLYDCAFFLWGTLFEIPYWFVVSNTPEEKRKNDIELMALAKKMYEISDTDSDLGKDALAQYKKILGGILIEDELERRWKEKDKFFIKSLIPNGALDEFKRIGAETNSGKSSCLDVGFQVWKVEDFYSDPCNQYRLDT